MTGREDYVTRTERDAGIFERHQRGGFPPDRPDRSEYEDRPERDHDWHGIYCSACGCDEASSFAALPCPGFEEAA